MVNIQFEPQGRSSGVELLCALEAGKGIFVSGEKLSRLLGVSRTSIWKHVQGLRRQGYIIESVTGKGHRLVSSPDSLASQEIQKQLHVKLLGRTVHHFPRLDSTQDVAFRLAQKEAPEGTLVVAEEQVLGRGRLGRPYFCPLGGLWFSLILRPPLRPQLSVPITLMAGVAVAEGLKDATGLRTTLKWPNDVLIRGRKVAGILTEMVAETDVVRFAICGIGVNANIEKGSFPSEWGSAATSLMMELGQKVYRAALLCRILESLDRHYSSLILQGPQVILDAWRQWPNMLGKRVRVTSGRDQVEGTAVEIDSQGALIVRMKEGKMERVVAGDVHMAEV